MARRATRSRRKPARRTTRRRSNPRSMYRASNRRRAMTRRRRAPTRRKKNVRGLFSSPGVRFGAYALAGAATAAVLNQYSARALAGASAKGEDAPAIPNLLKPKFGEDGARLDAGIVGAGLTFAAVMFLPRLKAATKANLSAAAVGMLTAPTVRFVTTQAQDMLPDPKRDQDELRAPNSAQIVARLRAANGNNNSMYNSATAYQNGWAGIPVS